MLQPRGRGARSPRLTLSGASAGRGRGAAPPSPRTEPVPGGRGRGGTLRNKSPSDDEMSSPPPASGGRGRGGTLRNKPPSDDEMSSPPPTAGRGRGAPIVDSDDDAPSKPSSASGSLPGRGRAAAAAAPVESPKLPAAGRGRGASLRPPESDSEDSPPPSPSPVAAAPMPSSGRGRGNVTVLPTLPSAGRGRGPTESDMSTDDDMTPRQSSPRPTSIGRGRGVSPPPSRDSTSTDLPSPRASVGPGRGRGAAPPAPVSTARNSLSAAGAGRGTPSTNISIDLSSDDEPWQPPPKKEPGSGRGVLVKEDPPAATSSAAGRARPPVPPVKPAEDEAPSVGRGRGAGPPSAPPEESMSAGVGRGRGSSATGSAPAPSGEGARASTTGKPSVLSDEEDEEPLTAAERRKIDRMFEAKERTIQTMDDLIKDLQPNEEELTKAMQLASYLEREKAAEEEEAAPVVQPKAVPFVTKTMSSESTVREAGLPTCLAVRKPWIAIGMTHGVVLVFDANQKLSAILGSQEGSEYGRVCSMSISNSAKMLLVGYGSGAVVLWDIVDSRKPVKVITDTHKAAVIHVDFLKDDSTWVSGDVDGKLVYSVLTSMLFVYYHSATDIVTGEGEVLALRSLRPGTCRNGSDGQGLCAACTAEGGLSIFSVFPKLHIWKNISRPDTVSPACVPYVSWREAVNLSAETTGDPILCVGWGTEILLYRMVVKGSGEVVVTDMGSFSLSSEIVSLTWLGYNAITILTIANEMKVFDPFSLAVLETSSVEVIIEEKNFKGGFFSCFFFLSLLFIQEHGALSS